MLRFNDWHYRAGVLARDVDTDHVLLPDVPIRDEQTPVRIAFIDSSDGRLAYVVQKSTMVLWSNEWCELSQE